MGSNHIEDKKHTNPANDSGNSIIKRVKQKRPQIKTRGRLGQVNALLLNRLG
jgi:hypothetical protein